MQRSLTPIILLLTAFATTCACAVPDSGQLALFSSVDAADTGRVALFAIIAFSTFISEDLACIAAGLLAARGKMPPFDAVAACYVGIVAGDMLIFAAGRTLGAAILPRAPLRWFLRPGTVALANAQFVKRGAAIIFISRFVPGSRAATSFAAGSLKQHAGRFAVLFALAAAVWTPLLVLASMQMGRGILACYNSYARWALPCLFAAALGLFVLLRIAIPLFSWRGRRLLLSRWRRFSRWEYWPIWAASGPVFFYVLYLGFIKYRKPTLFTVVNPGIPPESGFIGESKDAIYRALSGAGEVILPWVKIPAALAPDARLELMRRFMHERALAYPIVLKSDEGQRSLGVSVIHDEAQAASYLGRAPGDTLAQAYAPGVEFGVFYVRMPSEEHGRIISITEKHLTYVTGDGTSTLEALILGDPRAVCSAPVFLARFGDRLETVPAKGESVELVDIGTHAQGALFTDGANYNTPALLAEIERISQCFDGFYFGRYDLRAPSAEALMQGRGLKIIELNGVTGQCSHVYSPGNSVFYAWKTIMAQWRTAFKIAAENERRGHKPMPVIQFIKHWKAAAKRQQRVRESMAG